MRKNYVRGTLYLPLTSSTLEWEILYAGYHNEICSGFYIVRTRQYHVALGKWMSRDPEGYGLADNMYLFDYGNPLRFSDFSGRKPLSDAEKEELKDCLCRVAEGDAMGGLAWVECDGKGGLRVKHLPTKDIPSPDDQGCLATCGARKCVEEHEKVHIEQMKHINPDICKDKPAGGHIQISRNCTNIAECRAHVVDQECLNEQLKALRKKDKPCTIPGRGRVSCKSYIENRIKSRLTAVEAAYKCTDLGIELPGLPE